MAYVHSNVHMKGTRWAGFCLRFLFNIIFSIFHKKNIIFLQELNKSNTKLSFLLILTHTHTPPALVIDVSASFLVQHHLSPAEEVRLNFLPSIQIVAKMLARHTFLNNNFDNYNVIVVTSIFTHTIFLRYENS